MTGMRTDGTSRGGEYPRLWSIVLSGGNGRHLAPMVAQWLGRERPKQYCTFTGTRSMLQHTIDRADRLASPEHRITVVDTTHCDAAEQLRSRSGRVVVQPRNCDTAPGIYLPLTYVRAADPSATVVIYPADHFIYPETEFVQALRHAVWAVDVLKDRIIVMGVRPRGQRLDYRHIRLDRRLGVYGAHALWTVGRFIEQPSLQAPQVLAGDDLLWNTMVIVARVDLLWAVGYKILPSMVRLFETFQPAIGSARESRVLSTLYDNMPVRNFSTDILEHLPHRLAALDVPEVHWSDWQSPERIVDSLRYIGKVPLFPLQQVGVA
ncbi:hypothetical protein YTPLAS18_04760 [Nitrospira sp.]|nr:hypothetical protein YTPLAS18_04760 [Nitrospira sp.]